MTKLVTGNITRAAPGATFGDDGTGYIYSIDSDSWRDRLFYDRATNTVKGTDSVTYTFDTASHVLTITDWAGYTLAINMLTGDYRVTPSSGPLGHTSRVDFSLRDAPRQISSSWMTLGDDGARSETIITNTPRGGLTIDRSQAGNRACVAPRAMTSS